MPIQMATYWTTSDRSSRGLTLEDLKDGRLPDPVPIGSAISVSEIANGKMAEFPSRLALMLTRTADKPFSHSDWLFEPKLDGYRVMAFCREEKSVCSVEMGSI